MAMTMSEADEAIARALREQGFIHPRTLPRPTYTAEDTRADAASMDRAARKRERDAHDLRELRWFVREVWDAVYAETRKPPTIEDVREVFAEALDRDSVFETCDACGGAVDVVDEIPDEFGTQRHAGECPSCIDGRVPR